MVPLSVFFLITSTPMAIVLGFTITTGRSVIMHRRIPSSVLPTSRVASTSNSQVCLVQKNQQRNNNVSPEWQLEDDATTKEAPTTMEYTALLPGHCLPIQIGSLSLARKAWKKRRRTYSPILVPCSLLSIPHTKHTLRNNVLYLLHKYGRDLLSSSILEEGGKGGGAGVFLTRNKLTSLYRKVLGGDIESHATRLGYTSLEALLRDIIDSQTKFKYGVEVIDYQPWSVTSQKNEENHDDGNNNMTRNILLVSSLPIRQARNWVSNTPLAQITYSSETDTEHDNTDGTSSMTTAKDITMMPHTGKVKTYYSSPNNKKMRHFSLVPLSAALRIQQQQPRANAAAAGVQDEVEHHHSTIAGLVQGETRYAHVLQYDATGDDGAPLLTFCLDPIRSDKETKIRRNIIAKQQEVRQFKKSLIDQGILSSTTSTNIRRRMLSDLRFGEGPLLARVVRISARSNAAFVDVGVFREKGKNAGGGLVQVLGMLRLQELMDATNAFDENSFDDDDSWHSPIDDDEALLSKRKQPQTIDDLFIFDDDEDDEEEEEDISDMYRTDDDGMLFEVDQETGETTMLTDEDDDDDDDEIIRDDDAVLEMNKKRMLAQMNQKKATNKASSKKIASGTHNFLEIGDELSVYVNMVSIQSGRFMVTLDPSVKDKKGKDIKQKQNAEKRLSKLGEAILEKIIDLKGTECVGVIKAKSQNWFYVQPLMELPIGVAATSSVTEEELMPGDHVRIQLNGIDDSRGQLALTLLGKLSP